MKFLIVSVGYQSVAIPYMSAGQLGDLVAALSEARACESVGYGDDQRWVPNGNDAPDIKLVSGDKVTLGDEVATLKAQLAKMTKQDEEHSRYWLAADAEKQKLAKELKALKEAQAQEVPL